MTIINFLIVIGLLWVGWLLFSNTLNLIQNVHHETKANPDHSKTTLVNISHFVLFIWFLYGFFIYLVFRAYH